MAKSISELASLFLSDRQSIEELLAELSPMVDEPKQADIDAETARILAEAAAEQRRRQRRGG